ncbi:D-amino acid dehydrogenase small subunit [compost metagenome]
MGNRPSTPDSLPVIGQAPGAPSVYFAFGHGHSGLTLAAATGRIVADQMAGRRPHVDASPFSVTRFQ